jgi:hypothetical protein
MADGAEAVTPGGRWFHVEFDGLLSDCPLTDAEYAEAVDDDAHGIAITLSVALSFTSIADLTVTRAERPA